MQAVGPSTHNALVGLQSLIPSLKQRKISNVASASMLVIGR